MDAFAPRFYALGLAGSIGKGRRSDTVKAALATYKGVYLGATGGAGALLAQCITASRIIAYEHSVPEAIRELIVSEFPTLVINDCHGGELYVTPHIG